MYIVLAAGEEEEFKAILAFSLYEDARNFCQLMTGDIGENDSYLNEEDNFVYKINQVNTYKHSHLPVETIRLHFEADPNLTEDERQVLEEISLRADEPPLYRSPVVETPPPGYSTGSRTPYRSARRLNFDSPVSPTGF